MCLQSVVGCKLGLRSKRVCIPLYALLVRNSFCEHLLRWAQPHLRFSGVCIWSKCWSRLVVFSRFNLLLIPQQQVRSHWVVLGFELLDVIHLRRWKSFYYLQHLDARLKLWCIFASYWRNLSAWSALEMARIDSIKTQKWSIAPRAIVFVTHGLASFALCELL